MMMPALIVIPGIMPTVKPSSEPSAVEMRLVGYSREGLFHRSLFMYEATT